jgi:hypothetical protein
LRWSAYALLGALWLSGCAWLLLHFLGATRGDFGPVPHPFEGPLERAHGLLSQLALFCFGWFAARHAVLGGLARRRWSGLGLLAALVAVAIGGCLQLYVSDENWSAWLAASHEALGAAVLLPALLHWRARARCLSRGRDPRCPDGDDRGHGHGHDRGRARDEPLRPAGRSARS